MQTRPLPATKSSTPLVLTLSAALMTLTLIGCGEDIAPTPGPQTEVNGIETKGTTVTDGTHLTHTDNGDGTWTTLVDATSKTDWIGFDLDAGSQADATQDAAWDLAFQRFHIRTRGGINGTGNVAGLALPGTDFHALTVAPAGDYRADAADGADENADEDTVFEEGEGWYAYDFNTHKLTPRETVYVVRSDSGRYFKVQLTRYYDDAGTPARLTMLWGELAAPEGTEAQ